MTKEIANGEAKKKKILVFLLNADGAQSAYRIEKGTKIFWKDVPVLLKELEDSGKIRSFETSAGRFYEVVVQ